jgi:3-deoxy-D-manno-octulosonic acid (KDO) 8-phosphate synthase
MSYLAAGVNGIFLETHTAPYKALCDSDTMIKLSSLEKIWTDLVKFSIFKNTLNKE